MPVIVTKIMVMMLGGAFLWGLVDDRRAEFVNLLLWMGIPLFIAGTLLLLGLGIYANQYLGPEYDALDAIEAAGLRPKDLDGLVMREALD